MGTPVARPVHSGPRVQLSSSVGPTGGRTTLGQTDKRRASIPSAVRVGGMGKSELLQALRADNVQLNHAAEALFESRGFPLLNHAQVIEIVPVTVADLGFDNGTTNSGIHLPNLPCYRLEL